MVGCVTVADQDAPPVRPDFEGMEAWCRGSRKRRLLYGLIPLIAGIASALAASFRAPDSDIQVLFGALLTCTSVLPGKQYLDRSDWLQGVAILRKRWDALTEDLNSTRDNYDKLRTKLDLLESNLVGKSK